MSKAHNPLGKITSLCCAELAIFFVFNTCTGTRVALINPARSRTFLGGFKPVLPEQSRKQPSQISFRSGEMVPVSGIWRPDHGQHSHSEELWLRVQTPFPPCPKCGLATRFILMEKIQHISEDPDFQ
jgi:hypothetical protein